MASTTKSSQPAGGGLFLRKATGLVREVSLGEAIIFNILPAVPGLILAWSMFWILGAFPGVNMLWGTIIAGLLCLGICVAYGLLSVAMPRTGGDYIFVSRTLHPVLGLMASFGMTGSSLLSVGYWAWSWVFFGIGPGLAILGATTGNKALISLSGTLGQPVWVLIIGLISILGIALLLSRGIRTTMNFQNWAWWIANAGLALMAIILLVTTRESFMAKFNAFAAPYTSQADSYNYFIQAAADNGLGYTGQHAFGPTLAAVGGFLTFGMWAFFSTYLAGEVKGAATRKFAWSMVWAAIIQYATFFVMIVLLYKTIGEKFIASITFLQSNPDIYTLPVSPIITMLTSVIPGGLIIPLLIVVTFLAWIPLVHFIQWVQAIRAFFAMSFDRLLPAKLGDVNERTHAPITALIVCAAIGLVCLAWAVFSPTFMTVIVIAGLFGIPPILLTGIAAIVFPWKMKDLYEASPAKVEVLGVPLVSVGGVVAVIAEILYGYVVFKYGLLPPASQPLGLIVVGGVMLLAVVLYFVAKAVRKSQGIELDDVFKVLPPE
jgi:APA family basic amino acid/polyamine antiporter